MADIVESGPVFVDVASGTEYPITELISLATPQNDSVDNDLIRTRSKAQNCDTNQNESAESSLHKKVQEPYSQKILKEHRFKCDLCEYSTNHKAVFDEHVRVHYGIKPFQCSYCPYKSASKTNKNKHELIHRTDNPLRCLHCNVICRNKTSLNLHKIRFHPDAEEPESDFKQCSPNCKFTYKNLTELQKHRVNRKQCKLCEYVACGRRKMLCHMQNEHGESSRKMLFTCSICKWKSSLMPKILLHLIHHPNQKVDENVIDISILKEHGIMV